MKNFEDIQQSWLKQPVNAPTPNNQQLHAQWRERQQKVLLLNVFLTLGFSVAFVILGCLYFAFKGRYGWPFSLSIAAIYSILIVFLLTAWKSFGFKRQGNEVNVVDFIAYQLRKLAWQRRVLRTYVWGYAFFLWLAIGGFILAVLDPGAWQTAAMVISTMYILGICWWTRLANQKRLRSLADAIQKLQQLRVEL